MKQKEIVERPKDSQIEKDNMFAVMCHVTKTGCKYGVELNNKLSVANMTKTLNNAEFAKLETARYMKEIKANCCWPCSGLGHTYCKNTTKWEEHKTKLYAIMSEC